MVRRILCVALVVAAVTAAPRAVTAQALTPGEMTQRVGIDQKLGARLPADLEFVEADGTPIRLGDLLGQRPLILALVYYECPMLCGVAMEGLTRNLKVVGLEVGRDFDVVNVSIDPGETPAIAVAKKAEYLANLGARGESAQRGWHALTGSAASIETLANTVGFRYVYLPEADEYAHGTAVIVVTPAGEISRYFYGVEYPARDLRLGLVEAAGGGIGSVTDQLLLLCYHYDPVTGKYGFVIWSALRLAGIATVGLIVLFIVVSVRRERSAGTLAAAGGHHERG